MSHERNILTERLLNSAQKIFLLVLLLNLSGYAFGSKVRKEIKKAADGVCDGCGRNVGKNNLTAAHLNHNRSYIGYGSPENGRAFCRVCEISHHLRNHSNSYDSIGVNKTNNAGTIIGIWNVLNNDERRYIAQNFGDTLRKIIGNI